MERTGLGRYTVEIVRGLRKVRPQWELVILSNRTELFDPLLKPRQTRWPTQTSIGRAIWLHAGSRLELPRLQADLWFGTAFSLPLWWRGASAVTVHDLTFLTIPERYRGRLNVSHATWTTRRSIRRASAVISVSGETASALTAHFDLPSERIQVIHNGVSEAFHRGNHALEQLATREPYVLFVGTFEPRKGLDTLATALERLREEGAPLAAVIAGRPGWGSQEVLDRLRRLGAEIRIAPDDEELARLYRGALAIAHLSRQEGFGLPVAEAMASGAAVVATDLPCVREFAHDVPLYAEVNDAERVLQHLRTLREDPGEVERRRAAGRAAARPLRWDVAAERHAAVLERILDA